MVYTKPKVLFEAGEKMRYYREKSGYSQERIAEVLDISPNYYSEVERGLKSLSIEKTINFANFLNISLDDLYENVLEKKDDIRLSRLNNKINQITSKTSKRKLIAGLEALVIAFGQEK
jgi:transcriptional regulator with XRE-family HTH domain